MSNRRIYTKAALGALVLVVLCLAFACEGKKEAKDAKDAKKTNEARVVETLKLKEETFSSTFEATGNALPRRESLLACEVPGIVEKLFVQKGAQVKRGQPLLQLGQRDYQLAGEQAQAGLDAATAGADQMKLEFDRVAKLRESDATAVATYDRVKAQYDAAVAQKRLAEVGLKRAQKALADSTLRAPYDGSIVLTLIQEGEYAPSMPPTMLMKIVDSSKLEVQIHLPEEAASVVKKGAKAEVEIDSAGIKTEGEVIFVSDRIDQGVQTFETRILVDNPKGEIKAGAFCRVRLARSSVAAAVLVPTRAIARDDAGATSVFVLREGKAERQPVKLGGTIGALTHVLEGVKAGDELITSQINALTAGEAVVVESKS